MARPARRRVSQFPRQLARQLQKALRVELRALATLRAATAALDNAVAALAKRQTATRRARADQKRVRHRLGGSANRLQRSETVVDRADTAHFRAAVADKRGRTPATQTTLEASEASLVSAVLARDEAAHEMSVDASWYETVNALVAHAQGTLVRAEQQRIVAAANREKARATVHAAIEVRRKAQAARQPASSLD